MTHHWGHVGVVAAALLFGLGATLNKIVLSTEGLTSFSGKNEFGAKKLCPIGLFTAQTILTLQTFSGSLMKWKANMKL